MLRKNKQAPFIWQPKAFYSVKKKRSFFKLLMQVKKNFSFPQSAQTSSPLKKLPLLATFFALEAKQKKMFFFSVCLFFFSHVPNSWFWKKKLATFGLSVRPFYFKQQNNPVKKKKKCWNFSLLIVLVCWLCGFKGKTKLFVEKLQRCVTRSNYLI